jgi:hypothetical protein
LREFGLPRGHPRPSLNFAGGSTGRFPIWRMIITAGASGLRGCASGPSHLPIRWLRSIDALGTTIWLVALQSLSLRERRAIHMHYVEDRTFAEADSLLGTRAGNTRVTVHHALRKLRHRLSAGITEEGALT